MSHDVFHVNSDTITPKQYSMVEPNSKGSYETKIWRIEQLHFKLSDKYDPYTCIFTPTFINICLMGGTLYNSKVKALNVNSIKLIEVDYINLTVLLWVETKLDAKENGKVEMSDYKF